MSPERTDQPLGHARGAPAARGSRWQSHRKKRTTLQRDFVLQAYLRHGIRVDDGDCLIDAGRTSVSLRCSPVAWPRISGIFSFEPNPIAFACLKANANTCDADVTASRWAYRAKTHLQS